jgi:uracil-DNA glycosylase
MTRTDTIKELKRIHRQLERCNACTQMCGPPVHGPVVVSPVMLIGQAPGVHEGKLGRPFAYTAGKTLFKWLGEATGLDEEELRERIYIAAVARCFPGKALSGAGDREPSPEEILNCRPHLKAEILALRPKLILAVGKVAICEVLGPALFPKGTPLAEVVGKEIKAKFHGHDVSVIALPHPSGVSRWPQTEPGKTKLKQALRLLKSDLPHLLEPLSHPM